MLGAQPNVASFLRRGIERCRQGDWEVGLALLGRIAEGDRSTSLPGLFYSYLGYGIALRQKRVQEGLKLCLHSVKIQFYEPDNYANLARTYLLAGDRTGASRAVRDGLKVDGLSPELLQLHRELGMRSYPVLPFLARSNPLNQFLGRIRHAWRGGAARKAREAAKKEEEATEA